MASASLELASIQHLDWYDGPVSGLVRDVSTGKRLLAILLAFEPDRRQRVYALIPLRPDLESALGQLATEIASDYKTPANAEEEWERLDSTVSAAVKFATGTFYLIRCPALEAGTVSQAVELDLEPYRAHLSWTLDEESMTPTRIDFWHRAMRISVK